ncbi:type IX secretion system outer membrane channel protein PorV [Chitinophaga sp. XS-30]|uniref:type IX secretion system outer membrane channel protein PorV n=1 Tax=Chitinophaga sp. XS-30 TaxID=2604421 RepID=UPI0011DCCB95|nr:type IX secretion system outer membrane channel protein PorV [Chitinophaga sp. XS-30]QEH40666.1 type IX secretion system outer membrane channel protein PorV [Chitinophaga sp. XS-30]
MFSRITIALVCTFSLFLCQDTFAQISSDERDGKVNAINTAVPFLRISPDARSGAMGDVGLALSPDANAVYWNLSKLPFAEKKAAIAVTYTPWLKELVNDVFLAQVAGYTQLDENQSIGASLRYFSLGDIQFTDMNQADNGTFRPREFAFDAGYARRLSQNWSIGLALRYIHSSLATGLSVDQQTIRPGRAVAADLTSFYTKNFETDNGVNTLSLGFAMTNIGTKISYTQSAQRDFLPTNLGLGAAYTIGIDEYNKFTFALDINKLMVPTPQTDSTYPDKSVLEGLFSSFGDAPGGFKEELHELMYSVGGEYWYNNQFAVRVGYYNEHATKGNRKYFTAGLGVKYDIFGLNFSYLVPSGAGIQRNPLSNTLRFTLSFDLSRNEE